jgi:hypothetical protein
MPPALVLLGPLMEGIGYRRLEKRAQDRRLERRERNRENVDANAKLEPEWDRTLDSFTQQTRRH